MTVCSAPSSYGASGSTQTQTIACKPHVLAPPDEAMQRDSASRQIQ